MSSETSSSENKVEYILMARLKPECYGTRFEKLWSKEYTQLAKFTREKTRDFALKNYEKSHGHFLEMQIVDLPY